MSQPAEPPVIDVVHNHGGWINKFEGDAALAIWGAPVEVADRNAQALAAARGMSARLQDELPAVAAGIGISAGPVVSGNVGSADRYEYTVIGDPVNEAARRTAVSKQHPERCVANATLLEDAKGQGIPLVQTRTFHCPRSEHADPDRRSARLGPACQELRSATMPARS